MSEITDHGRSDRRAGTSTVASSPIIAVVGSLTYDNIFETERIPGRGESVSSTSLVTTHGGKGANIAVAAYRASRQNPRARKTAAKAKAAGESIDTAGDGVRVYMNGAVGDDEHGPALRAGMAEKGVDVTGVLTLPGEQTGQVVVMVERKTGQSSSLGFKGANLLFKPREEGVECLAGDTETKPDVLVTHCTLQIETVTQILEAAHQSGVETVLSASPAVNLAKTTYPYIDHLIFNEHEAADMSARSALDFANLEVAKEAAAQFVGYGVGYVIITLGEAGAVYATCDNERGHVPAERNVNVKDTTGAGDSFVGAYVVELGRQKRSGQRRIEKAVAFASKAAARTISQVGSQTALPWADEIE